MAKTPLRVAAQRGPALQLYGIVALDHAHDTLLPPGTSVVVFRDLGALVGEASYALVEPSADAVRQFHAVVVGTFIHRAIVPAPFGTRFESRDTLLRWLELHYFTLMEALTYVEDRVVARITVTYGEMSDATAETATAADLRSRAAETLRLMRRHAVASLVVNPSKGIPEPALASAFLVDRDRWPVFTDLVREEQERNPGLRIESTGPWPAYDFVHLQFGG